MELRLPCTNPSICSLSWLLMTWLLVLPSHQQLWYWPLIFQSQHQKGQHKYCLACGVTWVEKFRPWWWPHHCVGSAIVLAGNQYCLEGFWPILTFVTCPEAELSKVKGPGGIWLSADACPIEIYWDISKVSIVNSSLLRLQQRSVEWCHHSECFHYRMGYTAVNMFPFKNGFYGPRAAYTPLLFCWNRIFFSWGFEQNEY